MSKALTKEHVRKHYSSGAVAYYESGAPVRMMTPEESAYAAQRFDEWLDTVERAAAARALEEAGGDVEGIKNAARNGMNEFGPYPWHAAEGVSDWLRARAAEIRERNE